MPGGGDTPHSGPAGPGAPVRNGVHRDARKFPEADTASITSEPACEGGSGGCPSEPPPPPANPVPCCPPGTDRHSRLLQYTARSQPPQCTSAYYRFHCDLLQEALEYLTAGQLKAAAFVCKTWLCCITTNTRLRSIVEMHGIIAVGGWNGDTELETAEVYSPFRDDWAELPRMREKRSHVGCAVYDRHAYVIGGRDDERRLNTAEALDLLQGTWRSLPPMGKSRSSLALRRVGRYLYAFGGYDGHEEQLTNERFDLFENRWSYIAPLTSPRSQMASTVLGDDIYLCGGCDSHGSRILSTAQRYNVVTDTFQTLPDMEHRRLSAAAAVLNGIIYVLGGSSGQETYNSTECFDPRCNRWIRGPGLTDKRLNLAATTFEDTVVAVGGFRSAMNQLNCVERFYQHTHPDYGRLEGGCGDLVVHPPRSEHQLGGGSGLWRVCAPLPDARDAVNICVFE